MKKTEQTVTPAADAVRAALKQVAANEQAREECQALEVTAQNTIAKMTGADPADTAALDRMQKAELQLRMLPGRKAALEGHAEKLNEQLAALLPPLRSEMLAEMVAESNALAATVSEILSPYCLQTEQAGKLAKTMPTLQGFAQWLSSFTYAYSEDNPHSELYQHARPHAAYCLDLLDKKEAAGSFYKAWQALFCQGA